MLSFLETAEEFGQIIWPKREKFKINDLMLYGPIATKEQDQKSIDILLIHSNPRLDIFQLMITPQTPYTHQDELDILSVMMGQEIINALKNTNVKTLIKDDLFYTIYMNIKYFNDPNYKKRWDKGYEDPNFAENIFSTGFLWNSQNQKYDLPALEKYRL